MYNFNARAASDSLDERGRGRREEGRVWLGERGGGQVEGSWGLGEMGTCRPWGRWYACCHWLSLKPSLLQGALPLADVRFEYDNRCWMHWGPPDAAMADGSCGEAMVE